MPFGHGNNAPAAVLHPVRAAFPAGSAPGDGTGEAALRIAVGPDPGRRSTIRYRAGQRIARFWSLNASALRRRRVNRTDQPIFIPQARAASAARQACCVFQ